MKNSQRGFAPIVLIIIVVLVIAGLGYYFYSKNPEAVSTKEDAQGTSNTQTSNWKSYSDANEVFTMKYPTQWTGPEVKTYNTKTAGSGTSAQFKSGTAISGVEIAKYPASIEASKAGQYLSFNDYVNQELKMIKGSKSMQDFKQENITVSGKLGIKVSYTEADFRGARSNYEKVYLTTDGSQIITVYYYSQDEKYDPELFATVISNFKLTK